MILATAPWTRASPNPAFPNRRIAKLAAALLGATLAGLLVRAMVPQRAAALILPAATVDGPSEEIVGFGGVAMAADGTGGAVYLKRVEGVAHVFVSRFVGGTWQPPVRVDAEEPFGASWPRIGAAEGGQLVVVWATPFATESERPVDELLGATLGAGSSTFGRAILIDPDIRDGTGASPEIAVSASGQADVVYRVVHDARERETLGIPLLRPGDVIEDVRMAHYAGERWSLLGTINRNAGVSMRPPTEANAPRIAIGATGNGVVVWQEPSIDGVARIWARRFFGSTVDYVLPVSSESVGGQQIAVDADAPSVATTRLGEAVVAYRQGGGPGSPLPGPTIFLNTLPDGESADGSKFSGAIRADPKAPTAASASIGPPSVDLDEHGDLRVLYDANGAPRVIQGSDLGLTGALSLGPAFAAGELAASSVMNPLGGGTSAWPSGDAHGNPAVAVREDYSNGAVQTALVAGGDGGEVGELSVARSGLGDALIGFRQGPLGDAAIVVARTTAPPEPSILSVPRGWVKPAQASVKWDAGTSANGPLTYRLVLDGRRLPTPAGVLHMKLDPRVLGEGVHEVQILASDAVGESTLTAPSRLSIDGQPPQVRLSVSGAVVRVRILDRGAGLRRRTVRVSFGDGQRAARGAAFRHRYARAGIYTITVRAADALGNRTVITRLVSIR